MNRVVNRFIVIMLAIAPAIIQSASAAPVTLRQYWDASAIPDVLGELTTTARWDDSDITGVGAEFVFLSQYTVLRELNGIGQSFEYALLPDPADVFTQSRNTLVANYNNGVFQNVGVISHGGNGFVSLSFDLVNPSGTGVGFRQAGPEFQFIYPLPVSGIWYFNLDRSEFETTSPPPAEVPIPGAAILFLFGASMLGVARRMKNRPSRSSQGRLAPA